MKYAAQCGMSARVYHIIHNVKGTNSFVSAIELMLFDVFCTRL